MPMLTRGERFKDARIVHNQHGKQTMDEVAAATGVSKSLIQSLEDDSVKRSVGYDKVARLAKHYNVPADFLLELSDDPHKNTSAVDELGLAPAIVNWFKMLKDNSSNEQDYIGAINMIMASKNFQSMLFDLYKFTQVSIADKIFFNERTSFFQKYDFLQSIEYASEFSEAILELARSGKYNRDISSALYKMAQMAMQDENISNDDAEYAFDIDVTPSVIYEIYRSKPSERLNLLVKELSDR